MDKLLCHGKSGWNILLWDDFTMGILSVTHLRGGQRDIQWFEAFCLPFCLPFSVTEGPPKGLWGSPTVLKGQTSVPWKVRIKYSTMGWYHYGNTERYLFKRCSKEYLMIWGIFCCFQALKGPRGSPTVLNGHTFVPLEVEIKYSTMGWFHYGNTEHYSLERWTKGYLMIWGVLFAVFGHWRAP